VKIGAIKAADVRDIAVTNVQTGIVKFGPLSHSARRAAQDTAGTILHEASHALWQTKDHYARLNNKNDPLTPVAKDRYQALQGRLPAIKQDDRLAKGCRFYILQNIISR